MTNVNLKRISEIIRSSRLVSCRSGNLSFRAGKASYLITRSGKDLRFLNKRSFIKKKVKDKKRDSASIEWRMHAYVYQNIKDAHCVLHFQSPFLTTLSVTEDDFLDIFNTLLPESVKYIRNTAMVTYRTPGSKELAEAVLKAAKKGSLCMILENHGGLAIGGSVDEVLTKAEVMEFTAKTLCLKKFYYG